ncbi:hypothetical protein DUNSADRAFT_12595 [Dunaliella salina]|uniref:HMG box domain-containing protein n=1 Tax=Dunaliella salina TaxID=3046 RepID=A0ABQ7GB07_DUNSA|nr:hypothetical protein DUNSADRAFT_12595 [Dunaliella salina]|eukprot:KAF5831784.1 hypothetical protein DUNSADRAFT_12595 [Dunaliella salina]
MDDGEAEQAAHALALLSSEQGATGAPPPASARKTKRVQEVSMEHIRRQFALLQQQSLLSTDQVGQQLSWMRQQMGSLAMQIGSQGQDQADHDTAWELDTLQRLLQQSMSVLQFLEDKLYMVPQNMQQQPVPPQVPPPAAPFPYGMPFPPTSPLPYGVPGALEPLPAVTQPPATEGGLKEQPRPPRSAPARGAAASIRPGAPRSRLPTATSSPSAQQQQLPSVQHPPGAGNNMTASQQGADSHGTGLKETEVSKGTDLLDSRTGDHDRAKPKASHPKPARTFWKSVGTLRSSDQPAPCPKEPSAFDLFSAKAHADIQADNPGTALANVADKLRELWDDATPQQKKPFEEMAAAERDRLRVQRGRWVSPHVQANGTVQPNERRSRKGGQPSKPSATPKNADAQQTHADSKVAGGAAAAGGQNASATSPSAPLCAQTTPRTAFQLFSAARFPEVLRQDSSLMNLARPDTPSAEAAHILSVQWKESSQEEKEHWHEEAEVSEAVCMKEKKEA